MDIVRIIRKCDSWSDVEEPGDGRYRVAVYFDNLADAKEFKVEMMMVTSDQEPYDQIPDAATNGDRERG